jgi:hypothetical protein
MYSYFMKSASPIVANSLYASKAYSLHQPAFPPIEAVRPRTDAAAKDTAKKEKEER